MTKLPKGVTVVPLGDPAQLHDALAEALGESDLIAGLRKQLEARELDAIENDELLAALKFILAICQRAQFDESGTLANIAHVARVAIARAEREQS